MTRRLHSGLYEDLLASALEAEINARTADGWRVDVTSADSTVRPELLALMFIASFDERLKGFPKKTAPNQQTRLHWPIGWWRSSSSMVRCWDGLVSPRPPFEPAALAMDDGTLLPGSTP